MTSQGRRIAGCHLLLRGNRWMPISVNKALGAKDRCSPGGAVMRLGREAQVLMPTHAHIYDCLLPQECTLAARSRTQASPPIVLGYSRQMFEMGQSLPK